MKLHTPGRTFWPYFRFEARSSGPASTPRRSRQDIIDNTAAPLIMLPAAQKLAIDAIDNAEPIEPTDSTDPTEPMDSTDPRLPILSTESVEKRDNRELFFTVRSPAMY